MKGILDDETLEMLSEHVFTHKTSTKHQPIFNIIRRQIYTIVKYTER